MGVGEQRGEHGQVQLPPGEPRHGGRGQAHVLPEVRVQRRVLGQQQRQQLRVPGGLSSY